MPHKGDDDVVSAAELRLWLQHHGNKMSELCERTERIEKKTDSIEVELVGAVGSDRLGLREQFRHMRRDVDSIKRDASRRRGYIAAAVLSALGSATAAAIAWVTSSKQ